MQMAKGDSKSERTDSTGGSKHYIIMHPSDFNKIVLPEGMSNPQGINQIGGNLPLCPKEYND
jgi:hypothetical protein